MTMRSSLGVACLAAAALLAFSAVGNAQSSFQTLPDHNTTSASCSGTLTLFDTAGTAVASSTVTVPAAGAFTANTVTLGAPENTVGTARFAHTCPAGGFLAEAAIANFSITPTPYVQLVLFRSTRTAEH
jgi:hypothetical protein